MRSESDLSKLCGHQLQHPCMPSSKFDLGTLCSSHTVVLRSGSRCCIAIGTSVSGIVAHLLGCVVGSLHYHIPEPEIYMAGNMDDLSY